MSPREQVAWNISETCIFGNLNDVYGASVEKATDKNGRDYWNILFCKAHLVDGIVKVYSPSFILVSWKGRVRNLPDKGSQLCRSEMEAKSFIVNNFV